MPYEKVVISEVLGEKNGLGKPTTFLGIMKDNIWTDNRREIVLAIGRTTPNGKFYVGEVRKKNGEWRWVWGVPLEDIHGYKDLINEIKEGREGIDGNMKLEERL
jgi:hypothetical protein